MKKQFIPYELALKLKELGFNEECLGYYNKEKLLRVAGQKHVGKDSEEMMNDILYSKYCSAALWQQAFDFVMNKIDFKSLKTKFSLTIKSDYYLDEYSKETGWVAVEIARGKQACLEKLIEFIK